VADEFARRGARVVSGDALAHQALRQPEVRDQVAARWGPQILNAQGEVERRRLGAIVFADPEERRALEALLHPWIRERIVRDLREAQADPKVPLVVLDAAIMLEAGWSSICDRLVYVEAPPALRRQRVAQQRGWTAQEVEARERAQMPLTEKAARADHVLDNSDSLEHLSRQVDDLLTCWGLTPARSNSPPGHPNS